MEGAKGRGLLVGGCLLVSATALLTAATVWAATIKGTPRADKLRGTAKADTLLGLGGNDRLFGLDGNDVLKGGTGNDYLDGGAGVDKLLCGPGKDVAIAGPGDTATNCETVKGSEPPAIAQAGKYCGFTDQGQSICFDVQTGGRSFSTGRFGALANCMPIRKFVLTVDFPGSVPIAADGTFSYEVAEGDLAGSFVHGAITAAGAAKGDLRVTAISFELEGVGYSCPQVDTTWSAKRQ